MELSIVIPVYNEEENVEPLVSELTTVLSRLQQTYEIVIVDDGRDERWNVCQTAPAVGAAA